MTLQNVPNLTNLKQLVVRTTESVSWGSDYTQDGGGQTGTSGGGSISQVGNSIELNTSGTAGDAANAEQNARGNLLLPGGIYITEGIFLSSESPSNLAEEHWCLGPTDSTFDNGATIRPDVGANTSGNAKVASGGSVTNATVDLSGYGGSGNWAYLAIVFDVDGGSTEFYVNEQPLVGSADATVNTVPDNLFQHFPGGLLISNGNDGSEWLRVMWTRWTALQGGVDR